MQEQFLEIARHLHPDLPLECGERLVIVGGGEADARLLRELVTGGATLVAADGGANLCADAGLTPVAIIGDMDSLRDPEGWAGRTRLIEIGEQETTDFEKCLYATRSQLVIAVGMTGRRLDHTLAALDCAGRYAAKRQIIFVDTHDLALVCQGDFAFTLAADSRFSVHPLGRVTFADSSGLKYPLGGLRLAPGERSGTSNRTVAGPVSIQVAQGEQAPYLVMIPKHYLGALSASILS